MKAENIHSKENCLKDKITKLKECKDELSKAETSISKASIVEVIANLEEKIRPRVFSCPSLEKGHTDYFLIPRDFNDTAFAITTYNSLNNKRKMKIKSGDFKFDFHFQTVSFSDNHYSKRVFGYMSDDDKFCLKYCNSEPLKKLSDLGVAKVFVGGFDRKITEGKHRTDNLEILYADKWKDITLQDYGSKKVDTYISSWLDEIIKINEDVIEWNKPTSSDEPDPWWVKNRDEAEFRDLLEPSDWY